MPVQYNSCLLGPGVIKNDYNASGMKCKYLLTVGPGVFINQQSSAVDDKTLGS